MKEFKFRGEFCINMYLSKYQILQQQDLEEFAHQRLSSDDFPCNIYFIMKRPRVTINPSYIINSETYFELEFKIQNQNEYISDFIQISKPKGNNATKIISDYPYKYFTIEFENKNNQLTSESGVFLDFIQSQNNYHEPMLDYEVLYIGQAYGEDGNRTALDRLPSHSTLQAIYNEALIKFPDSEIWIMLAIFDQKKITAVDGRVKIKKENEDIDKMRIKNFLNPSEMKISEKQRINYTEAALIQTFKPRFNKEFKNTFPNPAHTSYSECYNLDINGIVIEVDLSEKNRWLYSPEKPRGTIRDNMFKYWQHGLFHFVNQDDRYKIFNNDYI
ncbi:hypothetical protein ACWA1F_04305 [Flavobacterium sp. 3-218]